MLMFTQEQVLGLVRTVLAFGAGILVSRGYVDEATGQQIVAGVIALGTAIWSYTSKKA